MRNANLIVKHHLHREVLNKRNRFKKKQGSIELSDDHDLDTVKIIGLIDEVDARGQIRDINIFIKDQKRQRHIEHLAENHRLITLDHDHDVDPLACRGFALANHLGHLVRRALMLVFRHNRRAPEASASGTTSLSQIAIFRPATRADMLRRLYTCSIMSKP